MAVTKRKPRMKRTQVSLSSDEYEMAKVMARERGVSLSQIIREAVRGKVLPEHVVKDPLRNIIGIVKDADPNASVNHDEIIYGKDIH
jgi:hypothetical protein